jgi:hypothetical protein
VFCRKPGGDSSFREHLAFHVVVVLAAGRLLDHGPEEEITGAAPSNGLAGHRPGRDGRVHGRDEFAHRRKTVAHAEVAGVVQKVSGTGGVVYQHRHRDLIADRSRVPGQIFAERIVQRQLAFIGELPDRDRGEEPRDRRDVERGDRRVRPAAVAVRVAGGLARERHEVSRDEDHA